MPKNNPTCTITQKTKGRYPNLPFVDIKEHILGKSYDLSLVLTGNTLSKKINKHYKGKDKPANVLAFPLSAKSGELFVDLETVKKQAPSFSLNYRQFLIFIFIHGLLHLKGSRHGSRMETEEKKWMKKYSHQ
ncbi:MAG TPA: rRNA maturation RNase YbeY [Candidatus Paceibacterota bacterium]